MVLARGRRRVKAATEDEERPCEAERHRRGAAAGTGLPKPDRPGSGRGVLSSESGPLPSVSRHGGGLLRVTRSPTSGLPAATPHREGLKAHLSSG